MENLKQQTESNVIAVRIGISRFDSHQFRAEMVRHQIYILFAPIGAIFVYQLLLVAGGTSEIATVGLAALASGITLNSILERAWKQNKKTLETQSGNN